MSMLIKSNESLHKKMKFSIKEFFIKCDQIRSFLRMWSHLLKKKNFMKNFIFLCSDYLEHMALQNKIFQNIFIIS